MPSSPERPTGAAALEALLCRDGELVLDRFDHWARTTPDRPFVYYGDDDRLLSFGDAHQLAARLAGGFAGLGVTAGDRVAVFLTHPLAAVLTMLAVWRLDAVYCPINYNLTGKLLAHPLRELAPRLLVSEEGRVAALDSVAGELATLPPCVLHRPRRGEHDFEAGASGVVPKASQGVTLFAELLDASPAPRAPQRQASTAGVLQTSGTTGPSKGVVLPHRWINQYTWVPRQLVDRDDVIHNDLPLYHGAGAITNVVRAAWVGCEVSLWDRFSASDFWRRIARRGATNAILIDVMIARLMGAEPRSDDAVNTLHTVNLTPLPADHHPIASRFGIDLVGTAYGQTETGHGAFALIDELPHEDRAAAAPRARRRGKPKAAILDFAREHGFPVYRGDATLRRGLMGRPTVFLEAAILGPDDEPLAPERYGQLAFRGRLPGLLLDEYLHRPEATAEVMRGGWLHTGDAAFRDEEGLYYYVDRMGGFIRSKGENISSFEVEELVGAHPSVAMCAAVGVPAREGLEEDVAVFVVARPESPLDAAELDRFAAQTMPRYLRPRHWRLVAELPRTPTNKVEKYRLRQSLLRELGDGGPSSVAPRGPDGSTA